jgi:hypothetical protein
MAKIVLSASRRTDIPAFYMVWFMDRIEAGFFRIENPFNSHVRIIPSRPEDVHTIVFWSKDFGTFLKGGYGQRLQQRGFNLFFNFTINSEDPVLEPRVPPLAERLKQLEALASLVPPEAINWRFDPVCFYRTGDGPVENNLKDFEVIARTAEAVGVIHCTTSFVDIYAKVRKRLKQLAGFSFENLSRNQEIGILLEMEKSLSKKGIKLSSCCEKDIFTELPAHSRIRQGACISHERITEIYGGELSGLTDRGQRIMQGCGCRESKDIGSYQKHPCFHNCLFCYANPSPLRTVAQYS